MLRRMNRRDNDGSARGDPHRAGDSTPVSKRNASLGEAHSRSAHEMELICSSAINKKEGGPFDEETAPKVCRASQGGEERTALLTANFLTRS